jgi:hypothetical protein
VHRLQPLHGDFRRSRVDYCIRLVIAGITAAFGVSQLVLHIQGYWLMRSSADVYLGAGALGFLAMAAWLLMRNGVWYRFEGGTVSAYRAGGTLLWQEDLKDLSHIVCIRARFTTAMTLHWPNHTLRMELYDSLEAALPAPPT